MRCALLVVSLLLGLSLGCRADGTFNKVSTTKFTGYVLPKDLADGWERTYTGPVQFDAGGSWAPTSSQAIDANKAARQFIARAAKDPGLGYPGATGSNLDWAKSHIQEIDKNYAHYEIQFVGIQVAGKKEILCNYFCPDKIMQLDPSRDFVALYDGGACFWHIEYGVGTKSCANLLINGD
jgi:hypothetical protein